MALQKLSAILDLLTNWTRANGNFAELEQNKADKTDLDDYVPNTSLGAVNGVATLDASQQVVQKAKTAITADDYSSGGTIYTKFQGVDTSITNIANGSTVVGKAKTLAPEGTGAPGQYFGTTEAEMGGWETLGWHDLPVDDSGNAPALAVENFTLDDTRWSTSGDVHTLTVPRNSKYPVAAYKGDGTGMFIQVAATLRFNATNAYVVTDEKFAGNLAWG